MTDPIADMLTRIRNAKAVGKTSVYIPYSKIKMAIANTLQKEGVIESCEKKGKKVRKSIDVKLKYHQDGTSYISNMKRISKPSQRIYRGYEDLFSVKQGFGFSILSTPEGIMTGKEARQKKIGGEILCEVW